MHYWIKPYMYNMKVWSRYKTRSFWVFFICSFLYIFVAYWNLPVDTPRISNRSNNKFFIAVNFKNNQDILPNFKIELLKVIQYLGTENVFVSIYESGSEDGTNETLIHFKENLQSKNISCSVIVSGRTRGDEDHRIEFLAKVRNEVMRPLYENTIWRTYDNAYVLFFNDIYFKFLDVVTLLETNTRRYDMACAMDFYYEFYDTWVSRDINGDEMHGRYPFIVDQPTQKMLREGNPVPVKCCWNGLVVVKAKPFLDNGIRFRASVLEDHCDSSECLLFCKDLVRHNYTNILMNPNVQVSYSQFEYYRYKYIIKPFSPLVERFPRPELHSGKDVRNINKEEWCLPHELKKFHDEILCYKENKTLDANRLYASASFLEYYESLERQGAVPPPFDKFCPVLLLNMSRYPNHLEDFFFHE